MSQREERFAAIVREHGPALGRVVASYAQPADQEDLAQDVAFAVWQALPRFRGECSERTFLFRIAHNRGISYLARRRVARAAGEVPGAGGDGAAPAEVADGAPAPTCRLPIAKTCGACSRPSVRCRSRCARCSSWRSSGAMPAAGG